jgi:thioredoxin 1
MRSYNLRVPVRKRTFLAVNEDGSITVPADDAHHGGIMKREVRAAAITLSLMLLFVGCAKAESPKAESVKATGDALVTFVELGSVNCVPCRMMQPILRDIESTYRGQVKVVFYDVWTEEGKPFAKQYGIRVIPTQVFLDASGAEYFRHEGFFPREKLVEVLKTKGVK